MRRNAAGRAIQAVWEGLPERFRSVRLDQFVVMPNHVHGIIVLDDLDAWCRGESRIRPIAGDHKDRPYGTLPGTVGRIVQAFKSIATREYALGVKTHGWPPFPGRLWQRNYYEHVIRNEDELGKVRRYVFDNPLRWAIDRENPAATADDGATPGTDLGGIEAVFGGARP